MKCMVGQTSSIFHSFFSLQKFLISINIHFSNEFSTVSQQKIFFLATSGFCPSFCFRLFADGFRVYASHVICLVI